MRFLIPPVLFVTCLGAMILLRLAWPMVMFLEPPLTYLGFVLVAAGLASVAAGLRRFKKAGTTHRPFAEAQKLVTGGIYRHTRNPMYLGLVLALAGACVLTGALSALVPVIIFIVVADRWYIRGEEAMLARKFGREFEEYKARTRRWL